MMRVSVPKISRSLASAPPQSFQLDYYMYVNQFAGIACAMTNQSREGRYRPPPPDLPSRLELQRVRSRQQQHVLHRWFEQNIFT
jgi:hypothetical protein